MLARLIWPDTGIILYSRFTGMSSYFQYRVLCTQSMYIRVEQRIFDAT